MTVYQLKITVYILNAIHYLDALADISKLIDLALVRSETDINYHYSKAFKYYSHSNLVPIEKDGVYKKGRLYTFYFRTVDKDKCVKMAVHSLDSRTLHLKIVDVSREIVKHTPIEELVTLTGVSMTKPKLSHYPNNKISALTYLELLNRNLIHKYNGYANAAVDEDFQIFSSITFKNHAPVPWKIKDTICSTNKVILTVDNSTLAQHLAYFALGVGIGEKNSRGCGYTLISKLT